MDELRAHLWAEDCGYTPGCIFDLEKDPHERVNLALAENDDDGTYAAVGEELLGLLQTANKDLFEPNRGKSQEAACANMLNNNGGFFGPFVESEDYYTGPFREFSDIQEEMSGPYARPRAAI